MRALMCRLARRRRFLFCHTVVKGLSLGGDARCTFLAAACQETAHYESAKRGNPTINAIIPSFVYALAVSASAPTTSPAEAAHVARDYFRFVEAGDAAGVDSLMALWSRDADVVSIQMGQVLRGREAIRATAEAFLPVSKRVRFILGKVEEKTIGPDGSLLVVRLRVVARETSDPPLPEREATINWVLGRTPEGWRILQEHFSMRPNLPPASPTPAK